MEPNFGGRIVGNRSWLVQVRASNKLVRDQASATSFDHGLMDEQTKANE